MGSHCNQCHTGGIFWYTVYRFLLLLCIFIYAMSMYCITIYMYMCKSKCIFMYMYRCIYYVWVSLICELHRHLNSSQLLSVIHENCICLISFRYRRVRVCIRCFEFKSHCWDLKSSRMLAIWLIYPTVESPSGPTCIYTYTLIGLYIYKYILIIAHKYRTMYI